MFGDERQSHGCFDSHHAERRPAIDYRERNYGRCQRIGFDVEKHLLQECPAPRRSDSYRRQPYRSGKVHTPRNAEQRAERVGHTPPCRNRNQRDFGCHSAYRIGGERLDIDCSQRTTPLQYRPSSCQKWTKTSFGDDEAKFKYDVKKYLQSLEVVKPPEEEPREDPYGWVVELIAFLNKYIFIITVPIIALCIIGMVIYNKKTSFNLKVK